MKQAFKNIRPQIVEKQYGKELSIYSILCYYYRSCFSDYESKKLSKEYVNKWIEQFHKREYK